MGWNTVGKQIFGGGQPVKSLAQANKTPAFTEHFFSVLYHLARRFPPKQKYLCDIVALLAIHDESTQNTHTVNSVSRHASEKSFFFSKYHLAKIPFQRKKYLCEIFWNKAETHVPFCKSAQNVQAVQSILLLRCHIVIICSHQIFWWFSALSSQGGSRGGGLHVISFH